VSIGARKCVICGENIPVEVMHDCYKPRTVDQKLQSIESKKCVNPDFKDGWEYIYVTQDEIKWLIETLRKEIGTPEA